MKRGEELLFQACGELAREEAEQLEQSLSRAEIRQAEEMYRHHRRKALALIRRGTKKKNGAFLALRIAAAVIVAAGALFLSLGRPVPEHVILTEGPTVSVAPYYSPEPSPSPEPAVTGVPSTPRPDNTPETEKWEYKATDRPILEETSTEIPTITPKITETVSPTATPAPASSPEPTPAPEETAWIGPALPEGWTGGYFPYSLAESGAAYTDMARGDGWQRVVCLKQGREWTFTEYEEDAVVAAPGGAAWSYVQWQDITALRAEDENGVTLSWVQDGRSFSLWCSQDMGTEAAESVRKIEKTFSAE